VLENTGEEHEWGLLAGPQVRPTSVACECRAAHSRAGRPAANPKDAGAIHG